MKKFPEVLRLYFENMTTAASAIIWSVRDVLIISLPPRRFLTAAVAIAVRGHKALTAIPS